MPSSRRTRTASAARSARKLTDAQKRLLDRKVRSAQFVVFLERLVAWGYRFNRTDMVLKNLSEHFFRDLPPLRSLPFSPYHPVSGTSAAGARPTARSAVTLNRVLASRNPEKLLAQATREEEDVLEANLPELLLLRDQRERAQAHARHAFRHSDRLRKQHRLMTRIYPASAATPGQKRRIFGMGALRVEASQACRQAGSAFEVADLMFRHARGLPPARPRDEARRRYKLRLGLKRFPRRWERVPIRKPVRDRRKGTKAPPRWRDLCPGTLVYMHVAGAYAHGRVIAYSLNLTHEVDGLARSKPLPAAWLRDRIVRRVAQTLGKPVELLVCLESHKTGLLHAHGVVADVPSSREQDVREALKLAGGSGYKGRQVEISLNRPDSGWASYIAKDFDRPFAWTRFAATSSLRASAESVFNDLRWFVLDYREPVPSGIAA